MTEKPLKSGAVAYFWSPQNRDRKKGCPVEAAALGQNYGAAVIEANLRNEHLDAWRSGKGAVKSLDLNARFGSVNWWIERFTRSDPYLALSERSQDDYREALERLAEIETEVPDRSNGGMLRVGALPVSSISPAAADLIYAKLRAGGVTRQANYSIDVARRAWKVTSRAYPGEFLIPNPARPAERVAINPFVGVERVYGRGTTEPATREEAYALSAAILNLGHPHLAIVPMVCFEWLQRPENVLAGKLSWGDYRPPSRPGYVRIDHKKTGKKIWQPLEDKEGLFFPELDGALTALPRIGLAIVLMSPRRGPKNEKGERTPRLYSFEHARHLVQEARAAAGLPAHVTFAACRHGGMTELGDSELTEQGVMALSGHATPQAARLYVKKTETQRLLAARKRRAWVEEKRNERGPQVGTAQK